jgi:hypothetical protein
VHLQNFAVFQNSYVFIPLFLSKPLKMFCENIKFRKTLLENDWSRAFARTPRDINTFFKMSARIFGCDFNYKYQTLFQFTTREYINFLMWALFHPQSSR